MHKRLIQATSAAILFASLAAPAFAGNGEHGRGNGFGLANKLKNALKKELKIETRLEKRLELKDDEDEGEGTDRSACLRDAEKAHEAALKAANETRKTALEKARSTFHDAIKAAQKTRRDAMISAQATFRASAKDDAAITVYVQAWVKAQTDWQKAKGAAQDAFETSKTAAEATWKETKLKADAAFKTAKEKCQAAPAPTPTPSQDTVAPSAVSLSLSAATSSSVLLTWTAPGDDGSTGTAASYDIRYAAAAITTAAQFDAATQVSGEPAPAVAGTVQTMTVSGLTAGTTYHFAIKAKDEANNASALSADVSIATLAAADVTAPGAITTLTLSGPTATSLVAAWTAPGDDGATGTAASYDIRYSTSPISSEAAFAAATQVSGEPAPAAAGTTQSMTVSGLTAATTYYFAMKAQDEVPNVSVMSNVSSMSTL